MVTMKNQTLSMNFKGVGFMVVVNVSIQKLSILLRNKLCKLYLKRQSVKKILLEVKITIL